jgi:hypothetical protein
MAEVADHVVAALQLRMLAVAEPHMAVGAVRMAIVKMST